MNDKCPRDRKYGDIVCRDGLLWALTYSDSAPPDQRQCVGRCDWPGHRAVKLACGHVADGKTTL